MGPTLSRAQRNVSGREKQAWRMNGMERIEEDGMEQPWTAEAEDPYIYSLRLKKRGWTGCVKE